jgi:hypothetical protein
MMRKVPRRGVHRARPHDRRVRGERVSSAVSNVGVMTLIVSHDGNVYQKDLGRDTAKLARRITRFDPVLGCTPVRAD